LLCKSSSRLRKRTRRNPQFIAPREGRRFFSVSTFRTVCSQERAEAKDGDSISFPRIHFIPDVGKNGIFESEDLLFTPSKKDAMSFAKEKHSNRTTQRCNDEASRRRSLLHRYRTDTKAQRNDSLNHFSEIARRVFLRNSLRYHPRVAGLCRTELDFPLLGRSPSVLAYVGRKRDYGICGCCYRSEHPRSMRN
jgi:hypothetical protein